MTCVRYRPGKATRAIAQRRRSLVVSAVDPYADIKAGTLAFYRLESDGTDSSGNGRTITMTASPTFAAGKVNNAVTFDGSTQYGSRAAILTSGSFWINFWVKYTAAGFGGLVSQCLSAGVTTGTFGIDTDFATGKRVRFIVRNASTFAAVSWGSDINDGNWHMVDAWYDGTNANLSVDNGTAVTGGLTAPAAFDSDNFQLSAAYGVLGTNKKACSIDNLLVANIAPSAAQRSLMWNGGAGYQLY